MRITISEFEWDNDNESKISGKHRVIRDQVEEAFFGKVKVVKTYGDRYKLYGITESGQYLTIIFMLKGKKRIRVISARPSTKKEKQFCRKK